MRRTCAGSLSHRPKEGDGTPARRRANRDFAPEEIELAVAIGNAVGVMKTLFRKDAALEQLVIGRLPRAVRERDRRYRGTTER
jgi:hypothetical protein